MRRVNEVDCADQGARRRHPKHMYDVCEESGFWPAGGGRKDAQTQQHHPQEPIR